MIDFACKSVKLDDIIKCSFSLTKTELKIFRYIARHTDKEYSTEDIASKLKLDISTVQKAMKKLTDQGILKKNQKNLSSGGYIFLYSCKSKDKIKQKIFENFQNFSQKIEEALIKW